MKARWANLLEIPQVLMFLINNLDKNALDQKVFTYPLTKVMGAYGDDGKARAYLPIHTGGILESMGWAENLGAAEKLESAVAMVSEVEREAHLAGVRELFFISSDGRTDEAAMKHFGFEKVTCFRKRL